MLSHASWGLPPSETPINQSVNHSINQWNPYTPDYQSLDVSNSYENVARARIYERQQLNSQPSSSATVTTRLFSAHKSFKLISTLITYIQFDIQFFDRIRQ